MMLTAHDTLDRSLAAGHGERTALRPAEAGASAPTMTYTELARHANRFANVLRTLGADRGERVFTLLGDRPERYPTALGTLRNAGVLCPLPLGLAPGQVAARLRLGGARVLVTTPERYRDAVAPHRDRLPDLEHVLLTGAPRPGPPGTLSWQETVAAAAPDFAAVPAGPEETALLHFTGGASGPPRLVPHTHGALTAMLGTAAHVLGHRPGDVLWCTLDPGSLAGTVYGILAPLARGLTLVVAGGDGRDRSDPGRTWRILHDEGVTVWHTTDTAVRALTPVGAAGPRPGPPRLRLAAVAGEPLGERAVRRARRALGAPVVEGWWQTETGGLVIAGSPGGATPPGSMGRPVPGARTALLAREPGGGLRLTGGRVQVLREPSSRGFLALRPCWPQLFHGYLDDKAAGEDRFVDGWYLTGDVVRRDADGWYWFVGRADDVISSAGQLVSPVEDEAALAEHPAVAEAAVVGSPAPDRSLGRLVTAYVTVAPGFTESEALREELQAYCRHRLGPARAPRRILFAPPAPRTPGSMRIRRGLAGAEAVPGRW